MLVELLKIAAIKVIKIVFCVTLELGGFKWFKNNKKRKNRNNNLFLLKLKSKKFKNLV